MKGLTLIVLSVLLGQLALGQDYLAQKRSLIRWNEVDEVKWLDFGEWKKERRKRDETPDWEEIVRDRDLVEEIGSIIKCVGDCRLYRGESTHQAKYRSKVKEGDELHTFGQSFVWVFLYDGTLVRLSPDSSISFKEINIGLKTNFLHVRMNSGNIFWMNRSPNEIALSQKKETDTLFLPLKLHDANPRSVKRKYGDDELFNYLANDEAKENQYKRLNKLIQSNNTQLKKKTRSFIVMPNGSLVGDEISAEFNILVGGKSYFKLRNEKTLSYTEAISPSATFYFRGFENEESEPISSGFWYEVDERGRDLSRIEGLQGFATGEFVTKRIPTIIMARELLFKESLEFSQKVEDEYVLANTYGFRIWEKLIENGKTDLERREDFLVNYTRRIETSNLLAARKLKNRFKSRGESLNPYTYNNRFYKAAIDDYFREREAWKEDQDLIETLNSTKKEYWKNLHGIY